MRPVVAGEGATTGRGFVCIRTPTPKADRMTTKPTRRQFLRTAAGTAAAACVVSTARATGKSAVIETDILDAKVKFVPQSFFRPLILSTGVISEITEAIAEVTVSVGECRATGRGSMYLSDLWAWPGPKKGPGLICRNGPEGASHKLNLVPFSADKAYSHDQRDAALRKLCNQIAAELPAMCGGKAAHPLELGMQLHESVCHGKKPPVLARAMCASPFDAAIHDAAGIATARSAFNFYKTPTPLPSADRYFERGDACRAIAQIIRPPKRELRAWYVVGKKDSMDKDVAPWIRDRGYRCFKIKIHGRDNSEDVARTIEVYRAARRLGAKNPEITVDTNEANPDAASVKDFFGRLKSADPEAFDALGYFEQPTARDIIANPFDWHEIAAMKPVLLDEGLTSLRLMKEALKQGWSGFALKTCKGHSFALVAAAWARRHGMPVSLQDLTNPGLALIGAALFAAHVPTINDVELNSAQFTPAANAAWLPRLQQLFAPTDGLHRLPKEIPPGLGSTM